MLKVHLTADCGLSNRLQIYQSSRPHHQFHITKALQTHHIDPAHQWLLSQSKPNIKNSPNTSYLTHTRLRTQNPPKNILRRRKKANEKKKKISEMNAIKRTFVLIFACGLIYMVDILIRSWQRDYWWHPISLQWLMFGITANVISVTSSVNYIPIIPVM